MVFATVLLLLQLLIPAASFTVDDIHTGFNYGAFWGTPDKPKRKGDYGYAFRAAKSLNSSVAFDSPRLFTCRQPGTTDEYIEAFDAAVEMHTYLLLGFYVSEMNKSAQIPRQSYETNADMLKYELRALEKALAHHGRALADLIIGLSVGNEDMESLYSDAVTTVVSENVITSNIATVQNAVLGSAFGWDKLFKTLPPIGHADTARNAAVQNADFIGANIFPFWHSDPSEKARASFNESLQEVKKRDGKAPVWIREAGWPSAGKGTTVSLKNMQKYWSTVVCSLIDRYTIFSFELKKDSHDPGDLDWGLIEKSSQKPKISDLSCLGSPDFPSLPPLAGLSTSHTITPISAPMNTSTFLATSLTSVPNGYMSVQHVDPLTSPLTSVFASQDRASSNSGSTTHITITSTITAYAAPSNSVSQEGTSQPASSSFSETHVTITSTITVPP
ncbi:uncharacterized protein CC84DRAFT_1104811, partial [Paraphaeosphaeria sporulosa]